MSLFVVLQVRVDATVEKLFLLEVKCFRRVGSGFISGKTEILIPEFFSVFRSFKNLLKCDCN